MNTQRIDVPGMPGNGMSTVSVGVMRMDVLSVTDAVAVVNAAQAAGIDSFDTADIYGFGVKRMHASSEVLGKALKEAGIERESISIQTKAGNDVDYADGSTNFYDFSEKHILEEVDAELSVLQTDYVDSFLLHRPDVLMEPDEIAAAFAQLQEQGKVRHFGVSNMSAQMIEYLQSAIGQHLEINQVQFSMTHAGIVDEQEVLNTSDDGAPSRTSGLLPYMQQHAMILQAWSPFQSGTDFGPYIDNPHYEELNKALRAAATAYGTSVNAIVTAWMLRLPLRTQVVAGTMNPQRLTEIAGGMGIELDRSSWYALYKAAGHLLP
ncbi:MAG: aldo/keto reductase [Bifidobacteriaceae bacterium]|jgi:predicted oxidoreductase|nr:aldo/keto reductase [Bifidobacteriaceae bacterium]